VVAIGESSAGSIPTVAISMAVAEWAGTSQASLSIGSWPNNYSNDDQDLSKTTPSAPVGLKKPNRPEEMHGEPTDQPVERRPSKTAADLM
jgi:hypothetical protein